MTTPRFVLIKSACLAFLGTASAELCVPLPSFAADTYISTFFKMSSRTKVDIRITIFYGDHVVVIYI